MLENSPIMRKQSEGCASDSYIFCVIFLRHHASYTNCKVGRFGVCYILFSSMLCNIMFIQDIGVSDTMDCKEFQRMIPDFLNDELDNYSLELFLNHTDSCRSCKEELTIQFLIDTGIQRLEDGSTFNLAGELQSTMNDAWIKLRLRKRLLKAAYFLQAMVVIELIAAIALSIALR